MPQSLIIGVAPKGYILQHTVFERLLMGRQELLWDSIDCNLFPVMQIRCGI